MSTSLRILTLSVLAAASIVPFAGTARAAPIGEPLAITKAIPTTIEPVYWRGRGGWGWGAPVAGGLIAGALIGGALAAPYYAPGYYPGPVYYGDPAYGPPPGDAISYCMRRFRSYDPGSGTYLGNDGYRHPCP
jgi:hypothetical protein